MYTNIKTRFIELQIQLYTRFMGAKSVDSPCGDDLTIDL